MEDDTVENATTNELENMKSENAELRERLSVFVIKAESYRAMLLEWLASTPTDKDGSYCPINQPQAFKAKALLND